MNYSNGKRKSPITFTPTALKKLDEIISCQDSKAILGVKIKVVSKGCGGKKYKMEYVKSPQKYDEVVEIQYNDESGDGGHIVKVFLDPKTLFIIIGTEVDYVTGKFETGFSFKNAKEKGRCGCGESFYY